MVTTANTVRMPTTTKTTTLWTRATKVDPAMLSSVMATTRITANGLTQASSPPVNALLA